MTQPTTPAPSPTDILIASLKSLSDALTANSNSKSTADASALAAKAADAQAANDQAAESTAAKVVVSAKADFDQAFLVVFPQAAAVLAPATVTT